MNNCHFFSLISACSYSESSGTLSVTQVARFDRWVEANSSTQDVRDAGTRQQQAAHTQT